MKIIIKIKNFFAKKKKNSNLRDKKPTLVGRWKTINGKEYHCLMIAEEEERI